MVRPAFEGGQTLQDWYVLIHLAMLYLSEPNAVADSDIGIITPYHAQSHKLRRCVAEGIKVGSVEEFQGQVCFVFPGQAVTHTYRIRNVKS